MDMQTVISLSFRISIIINLNCINTFNIKDTDISRLAIAFKIQAELALEESQKLIENATLDDDEIIQIIVICATFIGKESWTTPDLNKSAIGKLKKCKRTRDEIYNASI